MGEATSSEDNEEAKKWFDQGNQKFMEGDFLGAIASYDRAIEVQPDIPEVYYNRGTALSGLGRYEEAISSYDRAIELQPNYPNAYNNRGVVLRNLGRYEEAIVNYENAIKLKPDYHEAYNNQGLALLSLGRIQESIVSFEQVIDLKPDLFEAHYNLALGLARLKRYEDAITAYDYAIKLKSGDPDSWNNRGATLAHLDRHEAAITNYERAIQLKFDFPKAYNNWGLALANLNRYEEAIAKFESAIELKFEFPEAYFNRGEALLNLGQIEEGIISLDYALLIKPDYADAWLRRGFAVGYVGRRDPLLTLRSAIATNNLILDEPGYHGELANYEAGLINCSAETHPEGWGRLHQAIGKAHYNHGRRNLRPASYYSQADISYNEALKTLTKDVFPERYLEVLQDLIQVLLGLWKLPEAEEVQRRGADLYRQLLEERQRIGGDFALKKLHLKFVEFRATTVNILCLQGKSVEAWEVAEEGKNACLTWLLPGGNEEFVTAKYTDIEPLLNSATAAIYWHTSPVALTTFIIRADRDTPRVIEQQPEESNTEDPEIPEGTRRLQRLEKWLWEWDQDYLNSRKDKGDETEAKQWRAQLADRLRELADILNIPKILAELNTDNAIKQIILFPHQNLHRLPLESLFPNDFTLIRLPSVQMGLHLQQNCRHTRNTPSTTPRLLSVQPPNSAGLDDLPYAEMESTAVCHLFDSHTSIASHEVTREKLAQQLTSGYRIFHFSGHAEHEPLHPKLSQLYLSGSEKLKLEEICGLYLQGYDLVTLSACETAIAANQTITTEYVGLVSAFLYGSGVAHVLSTLWTVESEATAIVTLKFYTLFVAGETAPRAIAIAKQWLRDATWDDIVQFYQKLADSLRSKAPKAARLLDRAVLRINRQVVLTDQPFTDPYHWSAFAITGLPMSAPE